MGSFHIWQKSGGFAVLLVFPAWLLVKYLKKAEHIDYYDVSTDFNPFILHLNDEAFEEPQQYLKTPIKTVASPRSE